MSAGCSEAHEGGVLPVEVCEHDGREQECKVVKGDRLVGGRVEESGEGSGVEGGGEQGGGGFLAHASSVLLPSNGRLEKQVQVWQMWAGEGAVGGDGEEGRAGGGGSSPLWSVSKSGLEKEFYYRLWNESHEREKERQREKHRLSSSSLSFSLIEREKSRRAQSQLSFALPCSPVCLEQSQNPLASTPAAGGGAGGAGGGGGEVGGQSTASGEEEGGARAEEGVAGGDGGWDVVRGWSCGSRAAGSARREVQADGVSGGVIHGGHVLMFR